MKRSIEIPESYDELTPRQFRYLLRLFWRMMADERITTTDVQRQFANRLLGNKFYIDPYRRMQYFIWVNTIAETLQWLFTSATTDISLRVNTTANLLPRLGRFIGPQSHGSDLRFGEFRTACDIMNQYTADQDIDTLNALVGVLYRKRVGKTTSAHFDGNYRIPFNKHHIERNARRVAHLPEKYKYGVYLWFANFCEFLVNGQFIIEGRELCFAPVFGTNEKHDPDSRQPEGDKLGMLSILFTLADAGTFGNVEQTDNALLLDVMCKLLNDYNQAQNIKKK